MWLRTLLICAVAFFALASSNVASAAADACVPPPDLGSAISRKYPSTRVVTLADLEADDAAMFRKDHGGDCPGLTGVDFYGDGKPTFALVLAKISGEKHDTELVVAHEVGGQWKLLTLESGSNAIPYAPAVWSEPPGEYKDIYGEKTIRASRPVIVFCKYEAWAIVYAYTGKGVTKVWLMD